MSTRARVLSTEAIEQFKAVLAKFCAKASDALLVIEMDAQRVLNWLTQEQVVYWRRELTRRERALSQARAELAQRRLAEATGGRMDLTEQLQAVRAAEEAVR